MRRSEIPRTVYATKHARESFRSISPALQDGTRDGLYTEVQQGWFSKSCCWTFWVGLKPTSGRQSEPLKLAIPTTQPFHVLPP
mmetsp:Transcript_16112/g.45657  ORF Transcript_16112/g.45657 Transcript_16112/m.45657 type:complete len:83 (+) Transcript_16112:62-310(+)